MYCVAVSSVLGFLSIAMRVACLVVQPRRKASATVCLQSSCVSGYPSVILSWTLSANSSTYSSLPCLMSWSCLLMMCGRSVLPNLSCSLVLSFLKLLWSCWGLELKYFRALSRRHSINLSNFCSSDHLYLELMCENCVKNGFHSIFPSKLTIWEDLVLLNLIHLWCFQLDIY